MLLLVTICMRESKREIVCERAKERLCMSECVRVCVFESFSMRPAGLHVDIRSSTYMYESAQERDCV